MSMPNRSLKEFFLLEAKPFTAKREVDWGKVKVFSGVSVVLLILFLLCIPAGEEDQGQFSEKVEKGSLAVTKPVENDPTQETLRQIQESQAGLRQVHGSLDYLYRPDVPVGRGSGSSSSPDRNTAMILARSGGDTKTQLSAGARISVRVNEKVTVANQPMPIVGIVTKDVLSESSAAIPRGSKVLGEVSFDEESERASITWRAIILPDGRERPFSAIGVDRDGQVGISGAVHSETIRNATGQTLTRFVGAYAAGSMNTGAFGANQGGNVNGLRNAIAQTATDQANSMGQDMQKKRKWIDLPHGMETIAVLNQPFMFRDAGAML